MKSLILTFALFCASLFAIGQVSNNTVMVRVTETWSASTSPGFISYDTKIYVSFPDGVTREKKLSSRGVRDFEENTKKIHEALDMFFSDRYELVSQLSSGGDIMNNYIWIFREVK